MKKTIQLFALLVIVVALGGCSYKIVKTDEAQTPKPEISQSESDKQFNAIWDADSNSTTTNNEQQTPKANQAIQAQNTPIKQVETPVPNIALQEKCSEAAKKMFDAAGYKVANLDSYTNHWNTKLNKCFISTLSYLIGQDKSVSREKDLYDVYENTQYGTFFRSSATDSLGSPDCEMYPGGDRNNFQKCNSEIEFDNFVNQYMKN
jgi:outer membrane lipopolysaccharide assembly protein LptE/RlpB